MDRADRVLDILDKASSLSPGEVEGLLDRECAGDDLKSSCGVPFPKQLKIKPGETVVFSWILYKNKAHRDRVNAKVMKDPRLMESMDMKNMPVDVKRMLYGGFKTIVDM